MTLKNIFRRIFNKNLSLMIVGNIATVLVNVLMVKMLTNKYSTSDFGLYTLTMAFTVFPQLVIFAPLSASIFPFHKKYKTIEEKINFERQIFELFYFCIICLIPILLVLLTVTNLFLEDSLGILLLLSLFFSTSISALTILDSFSLANSSIKEYVFFPILNLILKCLMLCLLFYKGVSPIELIFIFSIIQILMFFLEYNYLSRKQIINTKLAVKWRELFNFKSVVKREILKYSKNFCIWGFFGWLQTFLDKFALQNYASNSTVAIYAVHYQYGFFPFTIISSILSQYITPIYFSKLDLGGETLKLFLKRLLLFVTTGVIIVGVGFGILSFYIAPFFIEILTNSNYLQNIEWFPIIVVAGTLYCFAQIITVPLLNSENVKNIRFPKVASSILALILYFVLIPRYGLLGILSSILISNLFYFVSVLKTNIRVYISLING